MSKQRIYLDNAASTAVDRDVLEAMIPYFTEEYANPSGSSSFSANARSAVETARDQAAQLIGASAGEIIFTSGGTESDNAAVFGVARMNGYGSGPDKIRRRRIIISATEHPAVLNPCRELEKQGFEVLYAPCDEYGFTDTDHIKRNCDAGTALVSIMSANNELGSLQDTGTAAALAHSAGAVFHTDAVQAAGHIPIDVRKDDVDLLSISSHKLHGPKGVGALFVRNGLKLYPNVFGGGQEKGLRSGTLNVPGIVGFGKACEIARISMDRTNAYLLELRNIFIKLLTENIPGVHINSCMEPGKVLPSILSVSFDAIEGTSLQIELDMKGITCSTGSACASSGGKPSHVLTAAGLSDERIRGSVRFSFSKYTTREELEITARTVSECVKRLREILG